MPARNVVAIASGKGGVGKTTVAVNVAVALAQSGAAVGLLDADIYGPNTPMMLGVKHKPIPVGGKLPPAKAYGIELFSMGFMVRDEQAIIWRGPMLDKAIRQFLGDVAWGDLDYLIVDMPPGTGDAQLTVSQAFALAGGVIVTLPQEVSQADARRGLEGELVSPSTTTGKFAVNVRFPDTSKNASKTDGWSELLRVFSVRRGEFFRKSGIEYKSY